MKTLFICCIFILLIYEVKAQLVVYDKQHHEQVMDNFSFRQPVEMVHTSDLKGIKTRIQNVGGNLGAIVLLQNAIYNSLVEVNSALKQGIMVKNMAVYTNQILGYCNEMISLSQGEPYLLLFAEDYSISARRRVIEFAQEVANLVLKDGKETMMDFTKRDQLLKRVTEELILLRGASYGALNSMRFAKRNGVLKKLNPLQNYINKDKQLIDEILFNYKYLRK